MKWEMPDSRNGYVIMMYIIIGFLAVAFVLNLFNVF
jgi:hypothetical protein